MVDIISSLAKSIFEKGYEYVANRKEFQNYKNAVKEQLKRELRLNLEIISEFFPASEYKQPIAVSQYASAFSLIKTEAFQKISDGEIPLSMLLSEIFDKSVFTTKNKKYLVNCANDEKLNELIERTYFRLTIAMAYRNMPDSKMDVGYLKFLLLSSIKALK